ncbi:hypothetical protein A6R68_15896, partial [Neotoma lepida]
MVQTVPMALLAPLAPLAPLASLVLVGHLVLNILTREFQLALDQWVTLENPDDLAREELLDHRVLVVSLELLDFLASKAF